MDEKIRAKFREFDKFWKEPMQLDYKDREVYLELQRFISSKQMVSLCGLRRVGKTTLLLKIISDLIKTNAASDILYFSFDEFQADPRKVIDEFVEIHGKKPRFIFFDEVQKIPNWREQIKIIYDFNKYKIFLTGSESLFLKRGSMESLAGRIYEFEITRLSFKEFLQFKGLEKYLQNTKVYDKELEIELQKYILTAGFPELLNENNAETIKKYVNSLIDKIIFIDLPKLYSVDDPSKIKTLLELLTDNPGMIVDLQTLSSDLGVHRVTIAKYLEYLEAGHLIVKLYNFSKNKSTSEKKLKKFYSTILTTAFANELNETFYSKAIENVVVQHVNGKYFWRDKYKDEVDVIQVVGKEVTPIEVKYRNNPQVNKGVEKFCSKYKCKMAVLVTKNTNKTEKNIGITIHYISVHQYLLNDTLR